MRRTLSILIALVLLAGLAVPVFANPSSQHNTQLIKLDYLLSIDRLAFYSEALADHLMTHEQPLAAEAIRRLAPEDFARENFTVQDLQKPEKWNELVLIVLKKRFPEFKTLTLQDINWNYNFFRNKLLQGFRAEPVKFQAEPSVSSLEHGDVPFAKRSIPKIRADEILLDSERYISEKTTRALFWDAALTHKGIEFHMGTERDFRQTLSRQGREVVAEIKAHARNYNKMYLVYDAKTAQYAYAITRISGDDRIKHLIAQLRILKYQNQVALKDDFVRVYGNANAVHRAQEESLLRLFKTLPKADLVVIGQKSAIGNVIAMAGMMKQVQPDITQAVETEKSPTLRLSQAVVENGSYFAATTKSSLVKSEFERLQNPAVTNYELFTSEQPSHDISDVLLETKDGRVVRWRLVSNMWGDEVVPLARALKNSGHQNVVYIGTAGGLVGQGLKVGDVVAPAKTYTQDGRMYDLEAPSYARDVVKTGMTLGQVTSPFDETKKWFQQWQSKIQVVELETGYLRDHLGDRVSFQPYLLISDIVGSEHETLAVAAADSGRRKNGQLKLLESLFLTNQIKAPVANAQVLPLDSVRVMYDRMDRLRPSRDVTSKLQLAQLALRQGLQSEAQLEALIKSEPAFDRQLLVDKLEKFSAALELLSRRVPNTRFSILGADEFLNGTWNAKKPLSLKIAAGQMRGAEAALHFQAELAQIERTLGAELKIEMMTQDTTKASLAVDFVSGEKQVLTRFYENTILKKIGLTREIDKNGGVRFREIPGFSGGMRCEAVLL